MENDIKSDLFRINGNYKNYIREMVRNRAFRQLCVFRKYQNAKYIWHKFFLRVWYHFISKKTTIELPLSVSLGEGCLMKHPNCITFNSKTVIGKNFTILKGATIGNTKDSNGNSFTPTIGDNVYIGLNSTVVGNIHVGNNVFIAPNTFVNFDVPDNSIVIGNPAIVKKNKNTVKKYLINPIK